MTHIDPATPRGRAARQRAYRRNIKLTLPTATERETRIRDTYLRASSETRTTGLGWYGVGHDLCRDMASTYGVTTATAAGVVAAYSPQTGWADNIRLATTALEVAATTGRTDLIGGHTQDACTKVSRILQGADPFTVLGGRKVRSFYPNLLYPHRSGPVTADRHFADMVFGRRGAAADRVLELAGVYALITASCRTVARQLGLRPHDLQAIDWVQWRLEHDVSAIYDYDPDEQF